MVHFDPPVSIKPLSEVAPGSFIRWGQNAKCMGFCAVSVSDPHQGNGIIAYDPETHRFNWQYSHAAAVVSYGNDLIVKPNVHSFAAELTVQTDATLYTLDGAPHLIIAAGNYVRSFNLATGELHARSSWPMMAGYRTWNLVTKGFDNSLVPLFEFTPRYGQAFEEEKSLEPENT